MTCGGGQPACEMGWARRAYPRPCDRCAWYTDRVIAAGGLDAYRLVDHFGTLQKLLSAGIDDLQVVEGVGELRARSVREGLSRLAESSITERYI